MGCPVELRAGPALRRLETRLSECPVWISLPCKIRPRASSCTVGATIESAIGESTRTSLVRRWARALIPQGIARPPFTRYRGRGTARGRSWSYQVECRQGLHVVALEGRSRGTAGGRYAIATQVCSRLARALEQGAAAEGRRGRSTERSRLLAFGLYKPKRPAPLQDRRS